MLDLDLGVIRDVGITNDAARARIEGHRANMLESWRAIGERR